MQYLMRGLSLIKTKGLKRYVVVPLTINLVLFASAFFYLMSQLGAWVDQVAATLPDWLSFLQYLIWPLALFSIVMTMALTFTMIANFIAAPFNGLLAEKTELYLTGQPLPDQGLWAFTKDIPRLLGREWQKLLYLLPRAIGFLLLFWVLPGIGQLLWFLFSSWMLAVQYCDYPFDNHKIPFATMRKELRDQWQLSMGFGMSVYLLSLVPLINLLIMPVAVCGATAMWVDHYRYKPLRSQHLRKS